MATSIEWTRNADGTKGETWNPTLGCSRVSPGCDGCYAIGVAHRAMQPAHEGLTIKRPGERTDWTGEVRCLPERLEVPLRRKKPTTFFVDSMSDLFHEGVPLVFQAQVFAAMARSPQHTFQILTKRPQRMARMLGDWAYQFKNQIQTFGGVGAFTYPLPNVWLGTSIESDRYTFRADHVRATPAAVRFLSLEPLLGPLPSLDLTGIDWVIVGGESGPGARPMHPDWVRDIRDRCVAAGIPFFFKQWGAWVSLGPVYHGKDFDAADEMHDVVSDIVERGGAVVALEPTGSIADNGRRIDHQPMPGSVWMYRLSKKAAGRGLDGRTWDEMPKLSQEVA